MEREVGRIAVPLVVFLEHLVEGLLDARVEVLGVVPLDLHLVDDPAAGADDLNSNILRI
jgi:hypothetical protein